MTAGGSDGEGGYIPPPYCPDPDYLDMLAKAHSAHRIEQRPDGSLTAHFLSTLDKPAPCNLDIRPDEAMAPKYRWMEGQETWTTAHLPKLPRSVRQPTVHGDRLDRDQMRDLDSQAPWQPLPVFDRRLIEDHIMHADFHYGGRYLRSPAGDVGGAMETSWKYQQMAGRLPKTFASRLNKAMKANQDLEVRQSRKGVSSEDALTDDKAAPVNREAMEDEDVARARMRGLIAHGRQLGYDVSLPEHTAMPNAKPLASIFIAADLPIGFASRVEMQYYTAREHKTVMEALSVAGIKLNGNTIADEAIFRRIEMEGQAAKEVLLADHKIIPAVKKAATPPPVASAVREGRSTRKRKLPAWFADRE